MKRKWAIRLTLWLLLGAIVNIAVAWSIEANLGSWWQTFIRCWSSTDQPTSDDLAWVKNSGYPMREENQSLGYQLIVMKARDFGIHQHWIEEFEVTKRFREINGERVSIRFSGGTWNQTVGIRVWVGWPVTCLYEERLASWAPGPVYAATWHHRDSLLICSDGSTVPTSAINPGILLPLAPIWPGFAINTIFYAAMLWVLFYVPGKVRRAIRRRRGLCPACAYPVGTSPVCTECGKPVRQRSAISDQQSALDNQS